MDTARNGAGRLVEHANIQDGSLQLDSGRWRDQVFREYWLLKDLVRRNVKTGGIKSRRVLRSFLIAYAPGPYRVPVSGMYPPALECNLRLMFVSESKRALYSQAGRGIPGFVRQQHCLLRSAWQPLLLLRGAIVNRTYGTHKNLYIYLFLLNIFGPIYYAPPRNITSM